MTGRTWKFPKFNNMDPVVNSSDSEPVQPASKGLPYRMWLLLKLPDGVLGLLQLSTGLLALLFDCGQLPLDQVVFLCLLSSSHLSLWT